VTRFAHFLENLPSKKRADLDAIAIPAFLKNPKASFESRGWDDLGFLDKIRRPGYEWPEPGENFRNVTAVTRRQKIGFIEVSDTEWNSGVVQFSHIAIFTEVFDIERARGKGHKRAIGRTLALSFLHELAQRYPQFKTFIFHESHKNFANLPYPDFYGCFATASLGNSRKWHTTRAQIVCAWKTLRTTQGLAP